MVIIYPMLTSTSVSQAIIPGVCKMLERYLLIYRIQDLLWKVNVSSAGASVDLDLSVKSNSSIGEGKEYFSEDGERLIPGEETTKEDPYQFDNLHGEESSSDSKGRKSGTVRKIKPGAASPANIDMPNITSLALEPTWVKVQSRIPGTMILGVKVVPYPIKAESGLVEMLQDESKLKIMDRIILSSSRKIMKTFWSTCKFLRLPMFSKRAITGDPEQDILWGASQFSKHNVFLLLNYMDITDEAFFSSSAGISNLYSVGWNSFAVADDINKRVVFCMKELKGLCSTIPYPFIYSSLSKDHLKVFEDLDDVRKTASPMFKQTKTAAGIFV